MVAYGTFGTNGTPLNIYKYLSDPVTYTANDSATSTDNIDGDGFYSTKGLQRQMANITSSQFSINNKALNYGSFDAKEIFFNNLCALGYENVDVSANGLNSAIVSLFHYFKYYGGCIQSLELIVLFLIIVSNDSFNVFTSFGLKTSFISSKSALILLKLVCALKSSVCKLVIAVLIPVKSTVSPPPVSPPPPPTNSWVVSMKPFCKFSLYHDISPFLIIRNYFFSHHIIRKI